MAGTCVADLGCDLDNNALSFADELLGARDPLELGSCLEKAECFSKTDDRGNTLSAGRAMLTSVHLWRSGPQPSILIEGASSKRSA
jgi:hypothetical protein